MNTTFAKQPSETLDYDIDLSAFLPTTDYPVSATKSATGTDSLLTFGQTVFNQVTKVAKQWISGGTDGVTYKVSMVITTNEGRIKEVDFNLKVKNT